MHNKDSNNNKVPSYKLASASGSHTPTTILSTILQFKTDCQMYKRHILLSSLADTSMLLELADSVTALQCQECQC